MKIGFWISATLMLAVPLVIGCGPNAAPPAQNGKIKPAAQDHDHKDHDHDQAAGESESGHDHSGWWCDEHGVPEGICAQCNSKVAAEFQKQGDWCQDHDRPDSQCFLCHPDLEGKFAAQYEAKYGHKPPQADR